jgi:hypothetical protein
MLGFQLTPGMSEAVLHSPSLLTLHLSSALVSSSPYTVIAALLAGHGIGRA